VRFEFGSGTILFYFSFIFVSFRESCLLVSWCAGGRCGMACSDKDRGRSRRPGVEDRGWCRTHVTECAWHIISIMFLFNLFNFVLLSSACACLNIL
jgi:hypothetical protein